MQREKLPPAVVDYADLATFEPQTKPHPEASLGQLARLVEWIDKHGGRFIPLCVKTLHPEYEDFAHNGVLTVAQVHSRDIARDGNIGLVPWTRILVIDIDSAEDLELVRKVLDPRYVTAVLNSCSGALHLILLMPEGAEPLPQTDGGTPLGGKISTRGGNDKQGFIAFSRSHAVRSKYPDYPDGLYYWFRHFNPAAEPVPLEVIARFRKCAVAKASSSNRAPDPGSVKLPEGLTIDVLDGTLDVWKHWGLDDSHDGKKQASDGTQYASRHTMATDLARKLGSKGFCAPEYGLLFIKKIALDYFGLSDDKETRNNIWRGYTQGLINYRHSFPRAPWPDAILFDYPPHSTADAVLLQYLYALKVDWLFNTADLLFYIKDMPHPVYSSMVRGWEWFEISGELIETVLSRLSAAARPAPIPVKVLRMEEGKARTPVKPEQVIDVGLIFPGERKHPHPDVLDSGRFKNAMRSLATRRTRQLVRAVFLDDPQFFPSDWRDMAMDDKGAAFEAYTKLQGYPDHPTTIGCKLTEFAFAVRANELLFENLLMRIMHPGCYVPEMAAWIGPGGTGKSAEYSMWWPLGLGSRFSGNAKSFDPRVVNDERRLFEFLRGIHCLTWNELRLFDALSVDAFISFSDAIVDKVRANYLGSWNRLRDWCHSATFQRKGNVPDLGRDSGGRRWLVLERTGGIPGEPRRSGAHLWRSMVLDELNLALWRWTRLKLEHAYGKEGWRPRVSLGFQLIDVDGRPLAQKNDSLADKQSVMPDGVPVPQVLRNDEKDWQNEQTLRLRSASGRRVLDAELEPVRDLFRERAQRAGPMVEQPVGFVGRKELEASFPAISPSKIHEIADEEGWRSGARRSFTGGVRLRGFEHVEMAQKKLKLDSGGSQ